MPNTAHHGTTIIEDNSGARYLDTANLSCIGLVATANDADPDVFPLNKPVLLNGIHTATGSAGETGTLVRALTAMQDQCEPQVVVVRVEEGESEAETTSNVIGGVENSTYTGLNALRAARADLGVVPRILGAPGLDSLPVTAEMVSLAEASRGFVYASCWGAEEKTAAAAYRQNFGSRALMLMWPDFSAWNTDTDSSESAFAVARALGLRAKIDQEKGWNRSLSNLPVNGVTGITKNVQWEMEGDSHDAAYLNQNEVTTLIRQEGFRFWGNRTCSADPKFAFECVVRTDYAIQQTIADTMLWATDKVLNADLVKDIVSSVNNKLRELRAAGKIIGGACWYDPKFNASDTLAAGKVVLSYDVTPTPPAENLIFRRTVTDSYFSTFAASLSGGAA